MIPEEFEKRVLKDKAEGSLPFFVNCTAGTTVFGAFDPIDAIAGEEMRRMTMVMMMMMVTPSMPSLVRRMRIRKFPLIN